MRQMLVVEEHLDGGCNLLRTPIVNGGQDPCRFGEDQMRYPGAACHEGLGHRHLFCVVSRDQPDQNVGVNGPHAASGHAAARPPSAPPASWAWEESETTTGA